MNPNKHPCTKLNETPKATTVTKGPFAIVAANGARTFSHRNNVPTPIGCDGSRSTSSRSRCDPIATTAPNPTPIAINTAAGHPQAAATGASTNPASAPPAGAPACLIEKISVRCRGGAVAANIRLPAGGEGPYPTPITSPETSNAGHHPLAATSNPAPASKAPACKLRTGPHRTSKGPPNVRNNTAPNAFIDWICPIRSGASPAPAVNNGATIGKLWFMKLETVCIPNVVVNAETQPRTQTSPPTQEP